MERPCRSRPWAGAAARGEEPVEDQEANQLQSSFTESCLGVLVNKKLNVNQQCTLVARKANSILDCISRSAASRLKVIIIPPLISMEQEGDPASSRMCTVTEEDTVNPNSSAGNGLHLITKYS